MTSPAAEAETPLIHIAHLSKSFGGVKALRDVRFDVMPGEILCLAGENGCGKSTLIKIISGVHRPEPGATMLFDGQSILGLDPAKARALGIQVIWQDLALFPEMSVAENIAFERNLGSRPTLVDHAGMRRDARRILERLGVALDLDAPVRTLPIAQRQVAAIARALIAEARLVFMDEPTASLSQAETDALLAVVRKLSGQGIAVVFVSHRLAEVLDVCTRVTVLRDGATVGTFPTAGMTQTRLTELMTGRTFDYAVRDRDLSAAPVVLAVEGLSRPGEYEDVSLEIRRGEILGLTGRLGSGRTELALSLFGMTRPASGSVVLDGKPLPLSGNKAAIAAGIAYVSEDRLQLGLVQPQSIGDNTIASVLDRLLGPGRLISGRRAPRAGGKLGRRPRHQDRRAGRRRLDAERRQPAARRARQMARHRAQTADPRFPHRGGWTSAPGPASSPSSTGWPPRAWRSCSSRTRSRKSISTRDRVLHMRDGRLVGSYRPASVTVETIEEAVHA